jgi:pimeloyl-ACP methyl ester carboxylesterase
MPFVVPKRGAFALAPLLLTKRRQPEADVLMSEWPQALREDSMPLRGFLGQFAGVLLHSTGFRLKNVDVPVVVVGAEHDVLVPPGTVRTLASLFPKAELEILGDDAHGIPLTDRDVVRRALEKLRALDT